MRTSGIARTAQLFFDPKDFTMIFSRNRLDIPSKMKTSNNISRTWQGRGSTVSHEGTDNAVDAEDPAQNSSSTPFDSVVAPRGVLWGKGEEQEASKNELLETFKILEGALSSLSPAGSIPLVTSITGEDDKYLGDPLLPESSTNDHGAEDDGEAKDLGIRPRIWIESKKLWYIAGPAIFSRVVNFSMNVITQAFAGHLGEVELAALSIGLNVIFGFSFGFLLGMASALETLCGQAFGAKRYHMLGIYLQRSWIVLFLTSILLLPIYIFAAPILRLLGQSDEVAEEAGVVALLLIPLQVGLVFLFPLQRFLQSQVKPFVIAWVSFAALLVNLLTTWIFIYVLDLGLVGAVVALDISWWVSVLALYGYVTCGGCPLSWTGFSLQAFSGLWEFVKLSVASGVMLCLESWYYTIVVLMTGYLKNATIAVDALSVCTNINGWEMMIHLGFFASAGVRVANELGAGNGKAARFATIVAVSYSFAIGLFFCILILILHDKVAYIYTSSAEVLQAVDKMSYLLGLTILLNSVQPVLSGVAVGSGWQAFVAYINLGCYYIIGLPLGFLMGWVFDFGVMGIWGGMIFGTAMQTLVLAIITIRTDWKKQANDAGKRVSKWSKPKPEPDDQQEVQH